MNDPRESQLWAFGGVNIGYDTIFPDYNFNQHAEFQFKLGSLVKSYFQVVCFSGAKEKGWNNEMMWAHYAENHKGVCLEFDEDALLAEIENISSAYKYFLDSINYREQRLKASLIWNKREKTEVNIINNLDRVYKLIAFQKSHFWEKEDEKRLIFINSGDYIFIPIVSSLKAIYFGLDFCYDHLQDIEKQIANSNAILYDVIYQHNKYERWEREKGCKKIPITRKFYL